MKYKADTGKMEKASIDIKSTELLMKAFAQRLNAVKRELAQQSRLNGFQETVDVRERAANILMTSLADTGDCLNSVLQIYIDAEKRVNILTIVFDWLKGLFKRGKKDGGEEPGGKCSKPTPIILPVPLPIPEPKPPSKNPQPSNPPIYYTKEEREADLRMRNEALAQLKIYENKWRNAKTDADKMVLLNSFYAELQKIMGTSGREDIKFSYPGPSVRGQLLTGSRTVLINRDMLKSPNSIILLKTVIHETRHLYQAEAALFDVDHPVSPERKQLWNENYQRGNYKTPSLNGYDAYRNQPIEADAFWFANQG